MSDSTKKYLIDAGIGILVAVLVCWLGGLFQAESAVDVMRILSDGFFVAGILFLGLGGLTWTKNGGVMDGLGFTFKTGIARLKADYETAHMTFAEYREEREKKASSPKPSLLAGLTHCVIAIAFFLIYQLLAGCEG